MEYERQIKEISRYLENQKKNKDEFKIGVEFEHFIIDKETLKTISYYGDGGVEDTLKELLKNGWIGTYEDEKLLGLSKDGTTVTLEPGSQFELSIKPHKGIKDIEDEYRGFLHEIIPILDRRNQALIAIGYHPESKIEDIKVIPKERYDYMFNYFKSRGKHAHNMMKGTASMQLTLDYSGEEDYIKKFRIANALSPVIYAMFDNSPFFENREWDKHSLRTYIWENCDSDRCGIVKWAVDDTFSYNKYAEYILNIAPILISNGEAIKHTGDKLYKEIFNTNDYTVEELEHVLTMVFPDVRTKKFIEIRMADSIPYPLNLSGVALWKGLLYNDDNLDKLYDFIKDITIHDIENSKKEIIKKGLDGTLKNTSIYEIAKRLITMAKKGLSIEESSYLIPLQNMIENKVNPVSITKERLSLGKKEALDWCVLKLDN